MAPTAGRFVVAPASGPNRLEAMPPERVLGQALDGRNALRVLRDHAERRAGEEQDDADSAASHVCSME